MKMTPRQATGARFLLNMRNDEVAKTISVHPRMLGKYEKGHEYLITDRIEPLRNFYEKSGVEFIHGGVKLRAPITDHATQPSVEQCRAARGLLGFTCTKLAVHAGLSLDVVNKFENGRELLRGSVDKLLKFFAAEGIQLVPGGAQDLQQERHASFPMRRALK